jgi:hypothetical protein
MGGAHDYDMASPFVRAVYAGWLSIRPARHLVPLTSTTISAIYHSNTIFQLQNPEAWHLSTKVDAWN